MITRKMLFGEGNFSGVGNEHFFFFFFFASGRDSSPIHRVSSKRFGGRDRAVHTWWGQKVR